MRKVLPHLIYGGVACLLGFASFFLWRKLCSLPSSTSSEDTSTALRELKTWQDSIEMSLASQLERVRSALGRFDREKRREKTAPEGQESPREGAPDLNNQGDLNKILAQKFHGVG